jgi:hypothetical protein
MAVIETQKASPFDLKLLEATRTSLEKLRIQLGNRSAALVRGDDEATSEVEHFYNRIFEASQEWEKESERMVARAVHAYPVWDYWLKDVKGIGEGLAAQMLSLLLPPLEDRGPSTWYKAAGLTVEQRIEIIEGVEIEVSRLPRARAGEGKLQHHKWLRRCLYNVATSFVRNGGYYREVYDHRKRRLFATYAPAAAELLSAWELTPVQQRAEWIIEKYGIDRMVKMVKEKGMDEHDILAKLMLPNMAIAFVLEGDTSRSNIWPLHRIDSVARWMCVKLFLAHLYEKMLEAEGKTGRKAFVIEQLGHPYQAPPEKTVKGKKI